MTETRELGMESELKSEKQKKEKNGSKIYIRLETFDRGRRQENVVCKVS